MRTLFKRISSRVAAVVFVLLMASPAMAQGPLGFQIFAPADNSGYGGGLPPNEGYFFQFDVLYWSISKPKIATIGDTTVDPHPEVYYPSTTANPDGVAVFENSSFDTGMQQKFSIGNRFEFGRVEDRNGWMMSIFQLRDQGSRKNYASGDVVFADVDWNGVGYLNGYVSATNNDVRLPVVFDNVRVRNDTNLWGLEAMYLHQFMTLHNGGNLEFFGGVRYMEFNERFGFYSGEDAGGDMPSFLAGSWWSTKADNHLIGPQVGGRYYKKQGRWMISTEGRFMAAMNVQNIHQDVDLQVSGQGTTNHPTRMSSISTTHDAYDTPFSPLIELRLEARYQITRAISFHAGWSGFWVDNIARPSGMVVYDLDNTLGINMGANKQGVFVNGVTIGFDVNR